MKNGFRFIIGFIVCFTFFAIHTSQTIGFGPNAVVTASLTAGGLINPPGYPLYTLFCDFVLFLFGKSAFVLNLVSAFFSSLSIVLFAEIATLIILKIIPNSKQISTNQVFFVSLIFCLLNLAGSPLFVSETYFANRYSLNLFLIGTSIYLSLKESSQKNDSIFLCLFFLLGLSIGTHYSSIPIILSSIIYFKLNNKYKFNLQKILWSLVVFITGLSPFAYIVYKSSGHPLMNWGDPENWSNFKNLLLRFQYGGVHFVRPINQLMDQFHRQYAFLFDQFHSLFILLALLGLFYLLKKQIKLGIFYLCLLLISGEFCTVGMNFSASLPSPLMQMSANSIMGEYYMPYFAFISLLSVIGLIVIYDLIVTQLNHFTYFRYITIANVLLGFGLFVFLFVRAEKLSQREFKMGDDFVNLVNSLTPEQSLILTNIDSFYFPLMYDQLIKSKNTSRIILHTELLKMSWYYPTIKKMYGDRLPDSIIADLQKYLLEYEKGNPTDDSNLSKKYYDLLFGLIDKYEYNSNAYVIFHPKMQLLAPNLLGNNILQPLHFGFRLHHEIYEMESESLNHINYENFKESVGYPWTKFVSTYITDLALRWVQEFQDLEPKKCEEVLTKIKNIGNSDQVKFIQSQKRIML